jgi:hypothetical protein
VCRINAFPQSTVFYTLPVSYRSFLLAIMAVVLIAHGYVISSDVFVSMSASFVCHTFWCQRDNYRFQTPPCLFGTSCLVSILKSMVMSISVTHNPLLCTQLRTRMLRGDYDEHYSLVTDRHSNSGMPSIDPRSAAAGGAPARTGRSRVSLSGQGSVVSPTSFHQGE